MCSHCAMTNVSTPDSAAAPSLDYAVRSTAVVRALQHQLDSLTSRVARLSARVSEMTGAARHRHDAAIARLSARVDEMTEENATLKGRVEMLRGAMITQTKINDRFHATQTEQAKRLDGHSEAILSLDVQAHRSALDLPATRLYLNTLEEELVRVVRAANRVLPPAKRVSSRFVGDILRRQDGIAPNV